MRKPSLLMISELMQIPFGHVCLVSSAKTHGAEADVFFNALQKQEELFSVLRDKKPTAVGFSVYDYTAPAIDQFFDKIREVVPSTWIGIGGPFPSNCLKGSVKVTTADFGIRGACEYVLPKVLHILADIEKGGTLSVAERQLQQIPSFYGLINGREVIGTDEKNYLGRDIENVPLDFSIFGKEGRTDCIGLVTQRGCGYRTCNFCTPQIVEGIWYGMSPDKMIELLVQLKKLIEEGTIHYGTKNIKFQDNDFLFDRTRAIEFAEKIRSSGLNDYFRFQTAQSSIDTLLVDHKSGNNVDIELVRLTRACYRELDLGTDGFTANDLKWLGKNRYDMKDIFRIAEVLFGERLPQKHYAILSNHKTTVNDLLLACYNIAKIAAINYPFFKIDANIGTQSFIGTKFHSEALPLLREGKYQEPAQHHHEQSPYYHWAENKDPMSLRTMKGYLELMDKGETDLPVFLPHVYSEDVCCSTLVAQYGMIAVARGLTSLNEVSNITDILKLAQTYEGEEPLEKRRAPKIRKTAQEYLHQLANVVRRSTDSNPYVKQVMMRPR